MINLQVFVDVVMHDLHYVLLGGVAAIGVIIALWVMIGIAGLIGDDRRYR